MQYEFLILSDPSETTLNERGAEGWRIVGVAVLGLVDPYRPGAKIVEVYIQREVAQSVSMWETNYKLIDTERNGSGELITKEGVDGA